VAVHLDIEEDLVLQVIEANSAYRTAPLDVVTERRARSGDEDQVGGVLDREVVRQVLDRLRPRERRIIEMRFFDEMTQAQIAEKIGTSQVHVGRLIASSLTLLRAHLEEPT
jgi:RNA polymerase sigma-B factor